jgi:hypothetical protein
LLLLALEGIYVLVFAENESAAQPGASFSRKAVRFRVSFVGLLAAVFLAMLILVWLWRMMGIAPAFLTAGALVLVGLALVGWSYVAIPGR